MTFFMSYTDVVNRAGIGILSALGKGDFEGLKKKNPTHAPRSPFLFVPCSAKQPLLGFQSLKREAVTPRIAYFIAAINLESCASLKCDFYFNQIKN